METLVYYWWECKIVPLLWKTVWQFLKKLNTEWPYDPAIPLLDIHKRIESWDSNKYLFINVYSSIIHRSQKMETTQTSIDRWMDKQNWYIQYNAILFSLKKEWKEKKNEILTYATTWMNLEDTMLGEISQKQKDKYYMIPLTWGP